MSLTAAQVQGLAEARDQLRDGRDAIDSAITRALLLTHGREESTEEQLRNTFREINDLLTTAEEAARYGAELVRRVARGGAT